LQRSGAEAPDGSQPAILAASLAGGHRQSSRTRPGPETHLIGVGNPRLEVRFDPGTGLVRIQDRSISSGNANVILVDDVDGAAGPRIVETLCVEPRFSGGFVDIDTIVRRYPALFPFLRCDARFPISLNTRRSRLPRGGK
jgi:hypothetical protein